MKFILLINVKLPTIVGILTFISKMNKIIVGISRINFMLNSVGHKTSFDSDYLNMSLVVRKPVFRVSDTNQAVQPQKMARGLKFRI